MGIEYHAHFTPSLMSAEALEATFVQRHALADRLMTLIEDDVTTGAQHHTLLVGQRGVGKTHLVSLLYNRVMNRDDLQNKIQVAWLREEEWGISSFLDLLIRILTALADGNRNRKLERKISELYDLNPEQAESQARQILIESIRDRSLLLIAENLDDLFHGLEQYGQQQFRALIQESGQILILATTPLLFQGVSRRRSPFYGFFTVRHLERLTLEEAIDLVSRSLEHRGEHELAKSIRSGKGRARIRVIHHLAGGNHRLYSIFAQFLTVDSLDQIVGPVLRTLDDLTPYYQSKVRQLPALQRKIVELLCESRGALPVQQIARRCFVTPQSTSSQLTLLRRSGYVNSETYGRNSYYELSEPLMRLSVEIKKSRGKPVRLLVDFLRVWFSKDDIESKIRLTDRKIIDFAYLEEAARPYVETTEIPDNLSSVNEISENLDEKNFTKAIEIANTLVGNRGNSQDWLNLSKCLYASGQIDEALRAAERSRQIDPSNASSLSQIGIILHKKNITEEAFVYAQQAAESDPTNASYQFNVAAYFLHRGKYENARDIFTKVINLDSTISIAWLLRGTCQWHLDEVFLALGDYYEALAQKQESPDYWARVASWLFRYGFHEPAVICFSEAENLIESDDINSETINILGCSAISFYQCGQREKSLRLLQKALEISPDDLYHLNNKGVVLYSLGNFSEAKHYFTILLEKGYQLPARFNQANAEISSRNPKQALATLRKALNLLQRDQSFQYEDDMALIRNLLMSVEETSRFSDYLDIWFEAFQEHNAMNLLGHGLVHSIPPATSEWLPLSRAQAWLEIWRTRGEDIPELELPLRMLNAAIEYRASNDPRALFSLPKEERDILKPLLRIPPDPADEIVEAIEKLLALRPSLKQTQQ